MADDAPDFDKLVEEATWVHHKKGEQNLWRATFALDQWYFVGHTTEDGAEPIVGMYDGRPYLIAFTDEPRATAFAQSKTRPRQRTGPAPILHMDLGDAITYCTMLIDQGVDGILFNPGRFEFHAGLSTLLDHFQRFGTDD